MLTIGFENGVPVSLDGSKMSGLELVTALNKIAGEHGVGRVDIMEDRMLGLKVRENYECPAAVVILAAHRALEALVGTQAELKFKAMVDREWGELAYKGLWFDPLKEDLEAFINKIQERVTGTVTMRLAKGSAVVVGRASEWALYNEDLASFDSKTFDQSESVGIVKTHGLQSRMYWSLRHRKG
jgi:argininosuccinate synthase